MENPIKMDDLGVPLFLETPIWVLLEALLRFRFAPYFERPTPLLVWVSLPSYMGIIVSQCKDPYFITNRKDEQFLKFTKVVLPLLNYTLPKTNISPENRPLEKEIPSLETIIFRGGFSC